MLELTETLYAIIWLVHLMEEIRLSDLTWSVCNIHAASGKSLIIRKMQLQESLLSLRKTNVISF